MSGLQITITTAGRAAIVNAENTGTAPLRIAQIGVTAQAFVPGAGMTALPAELKRLSTFAGAAVADDTVHVTIRDDSEDVYSLRGFALYLEDGTLFALYGQAGVILEKSAQAMLLLAADIRFVEISATSLTFGDTNWINPPATATVQGVVELADNLESIEGLDGSRAMTPAGHKAAIDDRFGVGAPSAFVKSLLALATAALMRTAIGLGNVATRNEGHGNGLDADLLDGQHGAYYRDWGNLTNKPMTFAPSPHAHVWGDLSGVPATAIRWPAFAEVTDKPTTYPPSGHTHAAADITSGVLDVLRIPDIAIAKVTGLQAAIDSKAPISNPIFAGVVQGASEIRSNGGSLAAQATAGQNAHLWLRDETGANRALVFWDRSSGSLRVRRYNAAGNATEGELSLFGNGALQWNGNGIWHSGSFDPSSKANLSGASFTGSVTAPNLIAGGVGNGAFVQVGDDIKLIDIGIANAAGVQGNQTPAVGYFYFGNSNTRFGWDGGNLVFGAGLVWHAGNFDPNSKASLNTNVRFRDVTCDRGNGTGVVFLNGANDRYLYWNGSSYELPGGRLVAAGGFQKGSSRELKNIEGPMPYGLKELLQIETVIGSYKSEFIDDNGRKRLFVVAEQLAAIVPEPVDHDAIEFKGRRVAGVDDGQLVPLLIKSVQELAAQVAAMQERL